MTPTIATLRPDDIAATLSHLLRLSAPDRSLRFAAGLVTDETIRRYAASIRFGHDGAFGLVDDDGAVVGLAHACVYEVRGSMHIEAAFSIDAAWRGRGFGRAMMAATREFAERAGADVLVGLCVARNLPMRRIFAHAGMTMTRDEDEIHAWSRIVAPVSQSMHP